MNKPFIIGITGGSGSGKTSVVRLLREHFSEKDVCIISQDDYYKRKEEQLQDENGIENFDLPSSINITKFESDLNTLRSGTSITIPKYAFNNRDSELEYIDLNPAPIIIVEGLFVFHFLVLRQLMNLKIFIMASDVVKVKRRILRDQSERNYPLDDVLYRYEKHVLPSFNSFILPYKSMADIIINNEFKYDTGLEVLEGYIKYRLSLMK